MTCQAPTPCGMTSLLGRSPETSTKGRQELIKRAPTCITLDSPSPSPPPNYIPFMPINPPNLILTTPTQVTTSNLMKN